MVKLYLRAGHGGKHSGAVHNGLVEKNVALEHTLRVYNGLMDYIVDLKLARDKDVAVFLKQSVDEANAWKANAYLSFHNDAWTTPTARGYSTHVHPQAFDRTIVLANTLHPAIAKVWTGAGSNNRSVKRNNFYELRETDMPAVLFENGFLSNPADAALLKNESFKQQIADATVKALADFYNLEKKPILYSAPLKRVFVNGTQVGAFRTTDALIRCISGLIARNEYDIEIKEVK